MRTFAPARSIPAAITLALLLVTSMPAWAETAVTDRTGQITGLAVAGDFLPVQTSLRIPVKGWGKIASTADARDVKRSETADRRTWIGRIEVAPGKDYEYRETLSEVNGELSIDYRVTAGADVDTEGVYFWLDAPITTFSGGRGLLGNHGVTVASVRLPAQKPAGIHFLHGTARTVNLSDRAGRTTLSLAFGRPLPVVVQDSRQWQGRDYSVFCQLAPSLKTGETTSLHVTLKVAMPVDHSPAHLALNASKTLYQLDGFGGDYCFNIESPVTQYTLDRLHIAWARTEMSLYEWEPQNENASPGKVNRAYLESQDKPGSDLHREFLLDRQIQQKGVPYVMSVWQLPNWMYADPEKGPEVGHRIVPPEKWPELLESIGSYLLYARRKYGVEPALFSFNEPNYGVRVYLSPEDHRQAIKRIGAYLRKLGLKTKMLLGDTTDPRGAAYQYVLPTAHDPDAMKYVGALAFHSWGGGTPQEYEAWAALSRSLHVPLLVTELGVDSAAWQTSAFDTYHYAMEEVKMYQDLLLYAHPQGTMQWEFTADYGIVTAHPGAGGKTTFTASPRYYFVRQFCNLTPHHSAVLATSSDNSKVLFTAFSGRVNGKRVYTLQIANAGASRTATIHGLPATITRLRAVRTSGTENGADLPAVRVTHGTIVQRLATQSLLTLTTLP